MSWTRYITNELLTTWFHEFPTLNSEFSIICQPTNVFAVVSKESTETYLLELTPWVVSSKHYNKVDSLVESMLSNEPHSNWSFYNLWAVKLRKGKTFSLPIMIKYLKNPKVWVWIGLAFFWSLLEAQNAIGPVGNQIFQTIS